jgi:AraC-like DNA-binding protein
MDANGREWSRYYRLDDAGSATALHARFVTHRYPRHAHDHFVVGLVDSGVQAYDYRGARHLTASGQVFLVNPGEPHTGEAATRAGYLYRTLYPSVDLLARAAEGLGARKEVPFFRAAVLDDPILARLLARLHARLEQRAPRLELDSLVLGALRILVSHHGELATAAASVGNEHAAVRVARDYIEAHFDEDLSLAKLADLVSLSPYHFARTFERELGLPPHAYLESVRIRKSRELLDQGMDLASAALAAGYADQSHFTRRFKRFLGVTPGQYRLASKFRQDTGRPSLPS